MNFLVRAPEICSKSRQSHYLICALNSAILTQAWYFSSTIVPNSYAAIGIRTHVSRVSPDWDLSYALPTELHGRGYIQQDDCLKFWFKACSIIRAYQRRGENPPARVCTYRRAKNKEKVNLSYDVKLGSCDPQRFNHCELKSNYFSPKVVPSFLPV